MTLYHATDPSRRVRWVGISIEQGVLLTLLLTPEPRVRRTINACVPLPSYS